MWLTAVPWVVLWLSHWLAEPVSWECGCRAVGRGSTGSLPVGRIYTVTTCRWHDLYTENPKIFTKETVRINSAKF